MTIAVAISFDAGILLCADTERRPPARVPRESTKIFPRSYDSQPAGARSIILVSEPVEGMADARQRCERALDALRPDQFTIEGMRTAIEHALLEAWQPQAHPWLESNPDASFLAALYSPIDHACSLFRTTGTLLQEFAGYDCQGTAGYFGHCVIRDRYRAAQSMDSLDLTTVFAIATETVESVRECLGGCGDSTEIMVMYANGRASGVQRIRCDTRRHHTLTLLGNLAGA